MQIANAITSESLIQLDDPRKNHFLATHYDCSKQNNLIKFSLTQFEKSTKALSENEYTRTFASVCIRAKAKRFKAFRCSSTIRQTRVFCAQGAHDKNSTFDRKDWHTNSMPLPKEVDPIECKNIIRNLHGTDGAELKKNSCNGSFTYFSF